MATTVKVTGAREIHRALLALGEREAKKIGRAALRKAARQIMVSARDRVPVKSGRLRKSLRVRVDQLRLSGSPLPIISALVYVSGSLGPRPRKTERRSTVNGRLQDAKYDYQIGSWPNVYGRFQEFGTNDTPAQPFFRPAWDSLGGDVALARIGQELGSGLERAANELRR